MLTTLKKANWDTLALLVFIFGAYFLAHYMADRSEEWAQGPSAELLAAQQDAEALASREWAGKQVCGPGALATWQDDKTLTCTPKRGAPYTVAGAK